VELRIPENLNANVSLHTSDGHIDVDVPLAVSGRLGTHDIQGKLNGGGELLDIHTSDGSSHVGRS
jgi:riboflavin synthase alpha subunit